MTALNIAKIAAGLSAHRKSLILGARLSPPSAWIVSPLFGGWEGVTSRRSAKYLCSLGLLYANAHGDYTLTALGERVRNHLLGESK